MSHVEQQAFCKNVVEKYPDFFKEKFVLDIGSLDINGNNHLYFTKCNYIGVDIGVGKNVDLVSKGHELNFPDGSFDTIISTECFEHDRYYKETLKNIYRMLKPGGLLVFTCATTGRPEHGTSRTSPEDAPLLQNNNKWKDYYKNLTENDIREIFNIENSFHSFEFSINKEVQDLYFYGFKTGHLIVRSDYSFQIYTNPDLIKMETELNQTKIELDQATTELSRTKAELDQATTELSRTKAELDQATTELSRAKAELDQIYTSKSWKITKPFREIRRRVAQPKQQSKRYIKNILWFVKRRYQALPFSHRTRARHRSMLASAFPKLLILGRGYADTVSSSLVTAQPPEIIKSLAQYGQNIGEKIILPACDTPLVSVVIPVYGKIEYTLHCLDSIMNNPTETPFEVIVVDDCSADNSTEILKQVSGIQLIINIGNQGFIRSCNIGAQKAQGEYLYFLNNDTKVIAGWLDELLKTFDNFPGSGLVGSKLIYPDGLLQEAGGIIWRDGSAWNFGKFQDPLLPVYNYAREVDYCSGASIMVPKALFDEIGGFDKHYLPAYCEDSDLALKIRDRGFRVIYQPLSTVYHYEGVSSGTDLTRGVKAHQVENSKKLFERWKTKLQSHQAAGVDVDDAKDRRVKRRVLVLDHTTPTPNQDAGSVTVFNLLLLLREMDFQVTFIPEGNFLYMSEYTTALQCRGIEVLYAPYVSTVAEHLEKQGERYDLALLFRPDVVDQHLQTIRKFSPNAKVLFHTVDLHFLRMEREAELYDSKVIKKSAKKMQQQELNAICSVDATIVHSTTELEILLPLVPGAKLHVFPLIMSINGTSKTFGHRANIVFIGGYQHMPNVDAVQYFVTKIVPLLKSRLPGVRFYIVGSKPPASIKNLASDDIIVTGFVEDLNSLLEQMHVSVAPLRYGAGIKGKIGTSMAVGLPVVATSIAAEGMSVANGENILIADSDEAFANAVVSLYTDKKLWNKLSSNGIEFANQTWGAETAYKNLLTVLNSINIYPPKKASYKLKLY